MVNKKVLLHERKRHTACCIASARYVTGRGGYPIPGPGGYPVPGPGGVHHPRSQGGTPSQVQGGTPSQVQGGTPSQVWGVPHPDLVRGYPILTWLGGTPSWPGQGVPQSPRPDLGWVPPPPCLDLGWGTPLARPEMGYSPGQTWDGVPPLDVTGVLPPRCGLTNKLKTVPSIILRMRAVMIKRSAVSTEFCSDF